MALPKRSFHVYRALSWTGKYQGRGMQMTWSWNLHCPLIAKALCSLQLSAHNSASRSSKSHEGTWNSTGFCLHFPILGCDIWLKAGNMSMCMYTTRHPPIEDSIGAGKSWPLHGAVLWQMINRSVLPPIERLNISRSNRNLWSLTFFKLKLELSLWKRDNPTDRIDEDHELLSNLENFDRQGRSGVKEKLQIRIEMRERPSGIRWLVPLQGLD